MTLRRCSETTWGLIAFQPCTFSLYRILSQTTEQASVDGGDARIQIPWATCPLVSSPTPVSTWDSRTKLRPLLCFPLRQVVDTLEQDLRAHDHLIQEKT